MMISMLFDKKSGDFSAPMVVPNHEVALRQLAMFSQDESKNKMPFEVFPEDFIVVTCSVDVTCSDSGDFNGCKLGDVIYTELSQILRPNEPKTSSKRGAKNGGK